MSKITIGHKNPDTDTVCSPIAYSWFLNKKLNLKTTPKIAGEPNKETQFVLKKFGVPTPEVINKFTEGDEIILLDTNNPEELIEGVESTKIIEIVDHHKLVGGITTNEPIKVTLKPLACTATIAWQIMKNAGVNDLPKEIAGIMLCAILSDTLKFTSPTTTDEDKKAVEELNAINNEDLDKLSSEMFTAKSDLTGMSTKDILTVDSKIFPLGGKKVRISVLETTNPQNALNMKADLLAEIIKMKAEDKSDYFFFFVIDILNSEATLIVTDDSHKKIAEDAFGGKFNEDFLKLPGVVSRKKQIVPPLESAIK
ncbi:MAG: hypothetical protein ACD_19C00176G0072 [uncultured bacterium]|nr:MAG: hypothetical protein ACD_19C00176G0072 [uncultured bacterium]